MSAADRAALLVEVVALAQAAGKTALKFYAEGFSVRAKADASPVTEADEAAEALILDGLARLTPGTPVISEEAIARLGAAGAEKLSGVNASATFWLVDPLDGTREFVARNGEFTVNIALIENRRPVLGVVHAPVGGATYAARGPGTATVARGKDAPHAIRVRPPPAAGLVAVSSRSHGDKAALAAYLDEFPVAERRTIGSAVKFGLVAEGAADLYPRLGPTMEWDTAAGHAILEAAGGTVTTLDGRPLLYGKSGFRNPDFLARGTA
ncbi:MAG: 3'(2'),5'-bisphosphate nucleotidase CysQ [Rhodospirillales bacterium]|nr:3'(2'),5'-bisphosphate nucleotidase CysQ [Rhodospirillales bacterium]